MDETIIFHGRRIPKLLAYMILQRQQELYEESEGEHPCEWSPYAGNIAEWLLFGQRRLRHG